MVNRLVMKTPIPPGPSRTLSGGPSRIVDCKGRVGRMLVVQVDMLAECGTAPSREVSSFTLDRLIGGFTNVALARSLRRAKRGNMTTPRRITTTRGPH
jgi:hypothetical protein